MDGGMLTQKILRVEVKDMKGELSVYAFCRGVKIEVSRV